MSIANPMQREARKMFQENINKLLKKRGLSQSKLSSLTNIPKATISGYVRGLSMPIPKNTEKLANALNVNIEDIDPRLSFSFFENYDLDESMNELQPLEKEVVVTIVEKIKSLRTSDRLRYLEHIKFALALFEPANKK